MYHHHRSRSLTGPIYLPSCPPTLRNALALPPNALPSPFPCAHAAQPEFTCAGWHRVRIQECQVSGGMFTTLGAGTGTSVPAEDCIRTVLLITLLSSKTRFNGPLRTLEIVHYYHNNCPPFPNYFIVFCFVSNVGFRRLCCTAKDQMKISL